MGDPGIELKPFCTLTRVEVRTPMSGSKGEESSGVVLFMVVVYFGCCCVNLDLRSIASCVRQDLKSSHNDSYDDDKKRSGMVLPAYW